MILTDKELDELRLSIEKAQLDMAVVAGAIAAIVPEISLALANIKKARELSLKVRGEPSEPLPT